jgi:hypothetical protein
MKMHACSDPSAGSAGKGQPTVFPLGMASWKYSHSRICMHARRASSMLWVTLTFTCTCTGRPCMGTVIGRWSPAAGRRSVVPPSPAENACMLSCS